MWGLTKGCGIVGETVGFFTSFGGCGIWGFVRGVDLWESVGFRGL